MDSNSMCGCSLHSQSSTHQNSQSHTQRWPAVIARVPGSCNAKQDTPPTSSVIPHVTWVLRHRIPTFKASRTASRSSGLASGPRRASQVRSSHTPLSGSPEHACKGNRTGDLVSGCTDGATVWHYAAPFLAAMINSKPDKACWWTHTSPFPNVLSYQGFRCSEAKPCKHLLVCSYIPPQSHTTNPIHTCTWKVLSASMVALPNCHQRISSSPQLKPALHRHTYTTQHSAAWHHNTQHDTARHAATQHGIT